MDKKVMKALMREARKSVAEFMGVNVREVSIVPSCDGDMYAEVNGEPIFVDLFNL